MPGFGGSVRMPRMLGADSALEIIAAGKDVGADQALKIGLVDGVVKAEKLVEGAKAVLRCSGCLYRGGHRCRGYLYPAAGDGAGDADWS